MQTVAIVGRPNVGKSTLFNRLTKQQTAIIANQPGVTRDRIYGQADWNGYDFHVIDTGGLVINPQDIFEQAIKNQVQLASSEADYILFVVDVLTSITQQDTDIATLLRKESTPVIVVVNKVDNEHRKHSMYEFYKLGFEHIIGISSINGQGTGELLDRLTGLFPSNALSDEQEDTANTPRIAILGQPNVGKSTLTNALLGDERTLVTEIAGTTRDAIHANYNLFGKELILIDTAGLRRKDRSKENVEFYSAIRTVKAIDKADVCMLMFDVSQDNPFSAQDLNIFSLVQRKGKGIILIANKWDKILKKETNTSKQLTEKITSRIAPFKDVPIIFTSAINKQRIHKCLEIALDIYQRRNQKISTAKLNKWLQQTTEKYSPPSKRGHAVNIKYMTQLPTPVVSFALFANHPKAIGQAYKQYLENQLRLSFPLEGIPIRLFFRDK